MIINHNIPALNTYNKLMLNNSGMSKSLEKLSSGLRINRAADDAAGLAISEKMRSQIRGLDQASRNAQDGISLIQTAEGALNETHSILQRMRELSVQAANDTYTAQDRNEIQKEISQLTSEIDRIANTTEFNSKKLLDGSTSAYVSTDKLTTRVFMRDGLRILDQFGQKAPGGGNYKLEITAEAGVNQVQKTDIFKIKHAAEIESTEVSSVDYEDGRFAKMCVVVNCGVDGGACLSDPCASFQLSIDFGGGCVYTICQVGLVGYGGDDIASAIRNDVNLANKVCAEGAVGCLIITSKVSGQDFSITATITAGTVTCDSGSFLFGDIGVCDDDGGVSCSVSASTNNACYGGVTADGITTFQATSNVTSVELCAAMKVGDYALNSIRCIGADATADTCISGSYSCTGQAMISAINTDSACATVNMSSAIKIDSVCLSAGTAQVSYKSYFVDSYGCSQSDASWTTTCVTLGGNDWVNFGNSVCMELTFAAATSVREGDTLVLNTRAASAATSSSIEITCSANGGVSYTCFANFNLCQSVLDDKAKTLNFFQVDNLTGELTEASLNVTFDTYLDQETNAVEFSVAKTTISDESVIGTIATDTTLLRDIDKFWDASGNFILEQPQTLTLVQGNGNTASITISGADTLGDVRDKLNSAISDQLGQGCLSGISEDTDKFVSYVSSACNSGLEAVEGTFVIRSAVAGKEGEISVVGDDTVIAALSLTTIQSATNNNFTVEVTNAHTGEVVADDVKISDNNLVGVINKNVDVQFDSSTGLVTTWDETEQDWKLTGGTANTGETFVHLADNTMVLHIGANQKQDIGMGIGNMGTRALGINNILVTSNSLANEAIGKIDSAISRVSSERSKLGALQNRLDHTINNLSTTSENLTAAESRIRDVDMAKEMMTFTKFQILANAATSMLAQANQMPQSVLQLLR